MKSKTETAWPMRVLPNELIVDPKRQNDFKEPTSPNRAKLRREREDPKPLKAKTLVVEPNLVSP
jgi:hypothetical protein